MLSSGLLLTSLLESRLSARLKLRHIRRTSNCASTVIGIDLMPIILHPHEQPESNPAKRFRDTIGNRLVAGVVFAIAAICSTIIRWVRQITHSDLLYSWPNCRS